jgi:hypothetical protein
VTATPTDTLEPTPTVIATPTDTIVALTPTATATPGSTQLQLASGWNLISLPRAPADTAIATVLSSINGEYDRVFAYNAASPGAPWKMYDTGIDPDFNTLLNLDEEMGFWLHTTQAATLIVEGAIPNNASILLVTGWNMVGYPSASARPIAEVFASIAGKYNLVFAYDAASGGAPWKMYDTTIDPDFNTLESMQPGWGYWLRVTENCTWNVP